MPLLKSVIKPLGMLGLTAATSATDAALHKKVLGTGNHTTLIISNNDLNDLLNVIRAGYESKKTHEIQVFYQNEPRFNRVYSRDNLYYKIKDGAHVINLDEYSDIGTHWIALYVNNKTVTYLDSSGVEHIPKEIKKFINNKNIIANIVRIFSYWFYELYVYE